MSFEKSNPDFLYIDAEAMIEGGNEQLKVCNGRVCAIVKRTRHGESHYVIIPELSWAITALHKRIVVRSMRENDLM